jgi:hypothetical protein
MGLLCVRKMYGRSACPERAQYRCDTNGPVRAEAEYGAHVVARGRRGGAHAPVDEPRAEKRSAKQREKGLKVRAWGV